MYILTATELMRVMNCHGSRFMPKSDIISSVDKQAIDEGDATHWLAVQMFNGSLAPENAQGVRAYNGIFITDEMISHVCDYLNTIKLGVMEIDTSHSGMNWQINGRSDHIFYDWNTHTLYIDDYKNGWRVVDPFENWTLISHAIGYIKNTGVIPVVIHLSIFQPKPYHQDGVYRTWSITYDELMMYARRIDETLTDTPEILTTGSQCHHCPAQIECPAHRNSAYNAIDVSYQVMRQDIPDDELSRELKELEASKARIEERYNAMCELGIHRITNGSVVRDYSVELRQGHTKFKDFVTPDLFEITTNLRANKKLPTPAEAKRRGMNDATYAALTERPVIGKKLKRIDTNKKAERIFGK